jgi:hypothetical protein
MRAQGKQAGLRVQERSSLALCAHERKTGVAFSPHPVILLKGN